MASYTAANFKTILNDASIDEDDVEMLVNVAVGTLNLLGAATISNMSSKTISLTSKQFGAVVFATRQIYHGVWKKQPSTSIGGWSISEMDVLANPTLSALLEKFAARLSSIAFKVAEDDSGIT